MLRMNRPIKYLENFNVKCDEENAIEFAFGGARLPDSDGGGLIERITVDTATDRRKCDGSNPVLARELERGAVARREQRRLAMRAAAPDRADRVNHIPRA